MMIGFLSTSPNRDVPRATCGAEDREGGEGMMRRLLPIGLFCFCATAAAAEPLPVLDKNSGFYGIFATYDEACTNALGATLSENYEGVERVSIPTMPAITELEDLQVRTITYVGVAFSGRYGDAEGSVLCNFASDRETPSNLEIIYEGSGLPGFLKYPLRSTENDPGKWRSSSFSTTLRN